MGEPMRFRSGGLSNPTQDQRLAGGKPDADPVGGGQKPRHGFSGGRSAFPTRADGHAAAAQRRLKEERSGAQPARRQAAGLSWETEAGSLANRG